MARSLAEKLGEFDARHGVLPLDVTNAPRASYGAITLAIRSDGQATIKRRNRVPPVGSGAHSTRGRGRQPREGLDPWPPAPRAQRVPEVPFGL